VRHREREREKEKVKKNIVFKLKPPKKTTLKNNNVFEIQSLS